MLPRFVAGLPATLTEENWILGVEKKFVKATIDLRKFQ